MPHRASEGWQTQAARPKMRAMAFSESTYASLDAELGRLHDTTGSRWHHALAVLLAAAAISIGWLIGG